MRISEMTMSKICDLSRRFAVSAFLATSTRCPSLRKVISSSSQIDCSSSTTRMWAISDLFLITLPAARHLRCARKIDGKFRAAIFFRNYADSSAVRLNNLIHNSQAETCSTHKSRLQRLEDLRTLLRVKSDARIAKPDAYP